MKNNGTNPRKLTELAQFRTSPRDIEPQYLWGQHIQVKRCLTPKQQHLSDPCLQNDSCLTQTGYCDRTTAPMCVVNAP